MKLGILTLPLHTNYGGILQAYALQTLLERDGHDVVVFQTDYYGFRKIPWNNYILLLAKRLLYKIFVNHQVPVYFENRKKKEASILRQNTDKFISQYIHTLRLSKSINELSSSNFDAIIVGSDQIWRPEYVRRMWNTDIQDAFLKFTKGWNIKRIAYAASFGTDTWLLTQAETAECSQLIRLFDAVSIREDSGVKLCQDHFEIDACFVLDPTMLLDKSDYRKLTSDYAGQSEITNELFCYILDETELKNTIINRIAKDYQLKESRITINKGVSVPVSERVIPPIEEWLSHFQRAKFIVTDSFHGCVFSIIFRKPFIAISNSNRGLSRFTSLLKLFGLQKHLLFDENDYLPSYSYQLLDDIDDRLSSLRKASRSFLFNALKTN